MFLQPDGTLFVQLINFAIFYVILRMVFLRTVGKAVAERRAYIDSLNHDYERYQAQARASREQAESIRAAARRDAEAALSKARAEASNTSAQIAAEYNQKAQAEVERAHETVEGELQAARAGEAQTVGELAQLMLSRALPESAR